MITEKFGPYTVLETLGTGSMGTVYKAEDPSNGRLVAVKAVRSNVLYDQERRERFLQDMLAVSLVVNPRICPILEIGDENDDFFVVTPLLRGRPLDSFLHGKRMPWREALQITLQALGGLEALHEAGVIHRAVKPSNIWVDAARNVVVSDCALARFTEIERRTRHRALPVRTEFSDTLIPLAALSYMSPEQVRGERVDRRTDVFSMAAVLYELLTGRHPFEARNSLSRMNAILEAEPPPLTSASEQLPEELGAVVGKALSKDPGRRHRTADEFASDLRQISEQRAPVTFPEAASTAGSWWKTDWLIWIVLALAVTGALSAAIYSSLHL